MDKFLNSKPVLYVVGVNHYYQNPIESKLLIGSGLHLNDYPFYSEYFSLGANFEKSSGHYKEVMFRLCGKFLNFVSNLVVDKEIGIIFEEGFERDDPSNNPVESNSLIEKAIFGKCAAVSRPLPLFVQIEPHINERASINGKDYRNSDNYIHSKENTEELTTWRENKWIDKVLVNIKNYYAYSLKLPILLIVGYCHLEGVLAYQDRNSGDRPKEVFLKLKEPLIEKLKNVGFKEIIKISEEDLWEDLDKEYFEFIKAKNLKRVFV